MVEQGPSSRSSGEENKEFTGCTLRYAGTLSRKVWQPAGNPQAPRVWTTMHTKDAGTVGELAVILQLKQAGFTVFTEVGDNSSIDLIVIGTGLLLRGQVKSCRRVNGSATLPLRKAGPNGYLRKYIDDVDAIDFF